MATVNEAAGAFVRHLCNEERLRRLSTEIHIENEAIDLYNRLLESAMRFPDSAEWVVNSNSILDELQCYVSRLLTNHLETISQVSEAIDLNSISTVACASVIYVLICIQANDDMYNFHYAVANISFWNMACTDAALRAGSLAFLDWVGERLHDETGIAATDVLVAKQLLNWTAETGDLLRSMADFRRRLPAENLYGHEVAQMWMQSISSITRWYVRTVKV